MQQILFNIEQKLLERVNLYKVSRYYQNLKNLFLGSVFEFSRFFPKGYGKLGKHRDKD